MTALPAPRAHRTRGRKGYSLGTWINLISPEPRIYALTLRGLLVHPAYGAFVLHKNGLWSLDKVARRESVKEDQAPNFALPKRYLSLVFKIRHGRVKELGLSSAGDLGLRRGSTTDNTRTTSCGLWWVYNEITYETHILQDEETLPLFSKLEGSLRSLSWAQWQR